MDDKKAIGVWAITNTLSVELFEIEHGVEDIAIVREPDGTVVEAVITYDAGIEDESSTHIVLDEMKLYFDECMTV